MSYGERLEVDNDTDAHTRMLSLLFHAALLILRCSEFILIYDAVFIGVKIVETYKRHCSIFYDSDTLIPIFIETLHDTRNVGH